MKKSVMEQRMPLILLLLNLENISSRCWPVLHNHGVVCDPRPYREAVNQCTNHSLRLPWSVIEPLVTKLILLYNLSSTWVPLERRTGDCWRWTDGTKRSDVQVVREAKGERCGTLRNNRNIYAVDCFVKAPALCQFEDCTVCERMACSYHKFGNSTSCFGSSLVQSNWFGAQESCRKFGGVLVSGSAFDIAETKEEHWIGYYSEGWYISSNDQEILLQKDVWDASLKQDTDNKCAVLSSITESIIPADCDPFICMNYDRNNVSADAITTRIHYKNIITVGVVSIFGVLVVICIVITKRRCRKHNTAAGRPEAAESGTLQETASCSIGEIEEYCGLYSHADTRLETDRSHMRGQYLHTLTQNSQAGHGMRHIGESDIDIDPRDSDCLYY